MGPLNVQATTKQANHDFLGIHRCIKMTNDSYMNHIFKTHYIILTSYILMCLLLQMIQSVTGSSNALVILSRSRCSCILMGLPNKM